MRTRSPDPRLAANDEQLRRSLTALLTIRGWPGHPLWEAIGEHLMRLATRDSRRKGRHAEDYRDAYLDAGIAYLRRDPNAVIAADSPWGAVVDRARHAGNTAIGQSLSGGLHARDSRRHRTHLQLVPTVVAFDPDEHDHPDPVTDS
jgi:hypothetical protein